jgi:hypothetical protein
MIRGESDEQEMKELRIAEEVAKGFVAWDISASGRTASFRNELMRILR